LPAAARDFTIAPRGRPITRRIVWLTTATLLLGGCAHPADKAAAIQFMRTAKLVSDVPRAATTGCALQSYNHEVCCDGVTIVTPETPEEVVTLVRGAMSAGTKIHTVGHAHTGNASICAARGGIEVSTEKLDGTIYLERHHDYQTVVVDAGVTMIELTEWLHQHNYSLGFHVLEFRDATIGGVIGTAAHGSAVDASSVVVDALESLWLVAPRDLEAEPERTQPKAYDKMSFKRADGEFEDEWLALTTNLGALGVVTRVRLRVWEQFNVRLGVSYHCESELLADHGVTDLLSDCDFGQLNWFPRANRVMKTCGVSTHDYAAPGMANSLLNPSATPQYLDTFKWYLRNMAAARGASCISETLRYWQLWWDPPISSTTGKSMTRVSTAIGPSHQMISSDLTKLEQQLPQIDLEVAVPMSRATDVLRYVNHQVSRHHLCYPLVGIFLRFSKTTTNSLLAHSAFAGEQAVMFVEMVMFKPGDAVVSPEDKYMAPYLALAEDLIRNFGGRAHWAKNNERLFAIQERVNPDFAARVARFKQIAWRLDPKHLFANAFTDNLGLTR
jgi:FAD binding domain-containing protein/D-arabinono-1,4-lactone oxidase